MSSRPTIGIRIRELTGGLVPGRARQPPLAARMRRPDLGDERSDCIEFRIGNCSLMVFRQDANIVEPIHQHGYRAYVADDPAGHRWTIAQARPTM